MNEKNLLISNIKQFKTRINNLVKEFKSEGINLDEFMVSFTQDLIDLHSRSYYYGRIYTTGLDVIRHEDYLYGLISVQDEKTFLANMKDMVSSSSENGTVDFDKLNKRMNMYIGKAASMFDKAMLANLPGDMRVKWMLGVVEEHCEVCPEYSSRIWTVKSLPTVPRACETPCLFNCGCYLLFANGLEGFVYED